MTSISRCRASRRSADRGGLRYQRERVRRRRRGAARFPSRIGCSAKKRRHRGYQTAAAVFVVLLRAGAGAVHTVTARLDNATDKLYRNHLSLIKDFVPEMGRNFKVVYSVRFSGGVIVSDWMLDLRPVRRAILLSFLALGVPAVSAAQSSQPPAASRIQLWRSRHRSRGARPPLRQGGPQQLREEVDRLRKEFESVRDAYGSRLAALEARLAQIGGTGVPPVPPLPAEQPAAAAQPPTAPPTAVPSGQLEVPAGAAGAGGPQGALPVYGGTTAMSKIFNPDIAVIGNFLGAVGKNELNPGPVFEMSEAEASFQAVVDPYARADFFLAFSPEGVEIEEGFLTFPTLPWGLLAKVGKLKQQVGKANTLHAHNLPWADRPLASVNLLGGEEGLADSGVSVSKLIANPWVFLEATGEVYQGNSGVFQSHERSDVSWVSRLRGYQGYH